MVLKKKTVAAKKPQKKGENLKIVELKAEEEEVCVEVGNLAEKVNQAKLTWRKQYQEACNAAEQGRTVWSQPDTTMEEKASLAKEAATAKELAEKALDNLIKEAVDGEKNIKVIVERLIGEYQSLYEDRNKAQIDYCKAKEDAEKARDAEKAVNFNTTMINLLNDKLAEKRNDLVIAEQAQGEKNIKAIVKRLIGEYQSLCGDRNKAEIDYCKAKEDAVKARDAEKAVNSNTTMINLLNDELVEKMNDLVIAEQAQGLVQAIRMEALGSKGTLDEDCICAAGCNGIRTDTLSDVDEQCTLS